MPHNPAALKALIEAELDLELAQASLRFAEISADTMVPATVRSENLNLWRDQQTAPDRQAVAAAIAIRDEALAATNFTLEIWTGHWEDA